MKTTSVSDYVFKDAKTSWVFPRQEVLAPMKAMCFNDYVFKDAPIFRWATSRKIGAPMKIVPDILPL